MNNIHIQNQFSNNEINQNGHHFLHHQLQQQQQQQQQLMSATKSPSANIQQQQSLNQSQLAKNFNNQFPSNIHSTYHPYLQLDKEKLNSLDKSLQPNNNLFFNGPINLNNKRPKLNTEQNKSFNALMIDPYYDLKKDFYNPQVYNPEVEAISPTNLDDKNGDSRKDEILNSIGKIDRQIQQATDKISKFKKRKGELEKSTTNSPNDINQIENLDDLKQLSTTQQIYTENKQKADESHKKLDKIRPLTIAVSF